METEVFRIENLCKHYSLGTGKRIEVIRDLNLVVRQGEFVAIVGPSGSGKSTLLNIAGCLDRPSSGKYLLSGRDVSILSDKELARVRNKEIGFVFQNFNLLPRFDIYHNVELPLIYSELPSSARRKKVLEIIEKVGLTDRIKHKPSELSGGQKQRVAIARALVNNPSVILADEPTGNLDSKTEKQIMKIVTGLNNEGRTIIMITHEKEIAKYASSKYSLKDGAFE
ncbi:MAG: ABC transporter ATP-binding protein [Fibrobacterota bacterium]